MAKKEQPLNCPCGSSKPYDTCCGRYHGGEAAPDAEVLMRSRYTAYVLALEPYLLATWHPSTRPAGIDLRTPPQPKWIGLEVKPLEQQDADHATVEFVARFKINGRASRMHELSRFIREDRTWFYLDGQTDQS